MASIEMYRKLQEWEQRVEALEKLLREKDEAARERMAKARAAKEQRA